MLSASEKKLGNLIYQEFFLLHFKSETLARRFQRAGLFVPSMKSNEGKKIGKNLLEAVYKNIRYYLRVL